ncbi:MAG TPA: PepSY-associated TM helix domain-containing protein [Bryobacteraceae bacterium]|nr:PepSY-associated TM helix domain-containing protein [Bryobacteraceae bacterium]
MFGSVFSKFVRQAHMYLALFLTPWVLLYALSTLAMTHRDAFSPNFHSTPWQKVSEQVFPARFSADASADFMGEEILRELNLDGNFRATLSKDKKTLTVVRNDLVAPRRITYTPADGHLLVEKQNFAVQPLLERMHRRRGYGGSFVADNAWAVSVDIVVIAMTFWILSGLWMWWELKITRNTGVAVLLSGIALFAGLILTS